MLKHVARKTLFYIEQNKNQVFVSPAFPKISHEFSKFILNTPAFRTIVWCLCRIPCCLGLRTFIRFCPMVSLILQTGNIWLKPHVESFPTGHSHTRLDLCTMVCRCSLDIFLHNPLLVRHPSGSLSTGIPLSRIAAYTRTKWYRAFADFLSNQSKKPKQFTHWVFSTKYNETRDYLVVSPYNQKINER